MKKITFKNLIFVGGYSYINKRLCDKFDLIAFYDISHKNYLIIEDGVKCCNKNQYFLRRTYVDFYAKKDFKLNYINNILENKENVFDEYIYSIDERYTKHLTNKIIRLINFEFELLQKKMKNKKAKK